MGRPLQANMNKISTHTQVFAETTFVNLMLPYHTASEYIGVSDQCSNLQLHYNAL